MNPFYFLEGVWKKYPTYSKESTKPPICLLMHEIPQLRPLRELINVCVAYRVLSQSLSSLNPPTMRDDTGGAGAVISGINTILNELLNPSNPYFPICRLLLGEDGK